MKNSLKLWAGMVLIAAALFSGCGDDSGGGGGKGSRSSGSTNDLAPASIGGKTFNGTIDNTTPTHRWRIDFMGDTTGTYTHVQDSLPPENGNYTYTKTGPNEGTVVLSRNANDHHSIAFTFTTEHSGTYTTPGEGE